MSTPETSSPSPLQPGGISGVTSRALVPEGPLESLVKRFDKHLLDATERNKHLDSIVQQMTIYNAQNKGVPRWLIAVLIFMGIAHLGTIASIFYIAR